jgi:hypothetical protein
MTGTAGVFPQVGPTGPPRQRVLGSRAGEAKRLTDLTVPVLASVS